LSQKLLNSRRIQNEFVPPFSGIFFEFSKMIPQRYEPFARREIRKRNFPAPSMLWIRWNSRRVRPESPNQTVETGLTVTLSFAACEDLNHNGSATGRFE